MDPVRSPGRELGPEAAPTPLSIAGPGGRAYAFLIDWHLRVLIAMAWLGCAWLFAGLAQPATSPAGSEGLRMLLIQLPAAAIYLLYHPVLEILLRGRTPGKHIAGVRILTRGGRTPGMGALLLRNIARIVDSLPLFYMLGFAMTLLTREHLRIGDLIAGTVLAYEQRHGHTPLSDDGAVQSAGQGSTAEGALVADLLARWIELSPTSRRALAIRMLGRLQAEAPATLEGWSDTELRAGLQRLLEG